MLTQAKIDLINSLDEIWPDVWGWLFLDEPLYEIIDCISPVGISEQEVINFRLYLESLNLFELFEMAKADLLQGKPSPSLVVLRRWPGEEILAVIKQLLQSSAEIDRLVAMRIVQDDRKECGTLEFKNLIYKVLQSEHNEDVITAAIYTLNNLWFRDCNDLIFRFADHPNQNVRQAVAECVGGQDAPEAIAITLKLLNDPSEVVRGWAAYLLALELFITGDEIENALISAVVNSTISREDKSVVILGLASRRNSKAPELIIEALVDLPVCPAIFEAAEKMPRKEYLPELESLRKSYSFSDYHTQLLNDAITADPTPKT